MKVGIRRKKGRGMMIMWVKGGEEGRMGERKEGGKGGGKPVHRLVELHQRNKYAL